MAEEKLVLSVLVDNVSGVLQRVASLFSRRGYNISSLTVSETEDPLFSRMTIETYTEPENFRQIRAQISKLEIVKKVAVLNAENSVSSELLLVKVRAKGIEELLMLLLKALPLSLRAERKQLKTLLKRFRRSALLKWQKQV